MDAPKLYFTEKETARMLGVSTAKLQKERWLQKGMAYFKFGRNIRYHQDDIDEYQRSCRVDFRKAS